MNKSKLKALTDANWTHLEALMLVKELRVVAEQLRADYDDMHLRVAAIVAGREHADK